MYWSQDIVISVLFPYLLPSLPVFKNECWLREDMKQIFEELLIFYCSISIERTQVLLETFVKRVLSISSSYKRNLERDLYFLADIDERCSFSKLIKCCSSEYSLYTCNFLIEHKVDFHEQDSYALRVQSFRGHSDTVSLLLQHKANVHAGDDHALRWAIRPNRFYKCTNVQNVHESEKCQVSSY
jgi:hypothetical protein